MHPEDIDDLFRQQLDGHASPPSNDLWARLHLPGPAAEPEAALPDALFRAGLHGHATPPRRELWERLEDEHLRPQPRRRRVAAWWQYSAAAVLLLLLLAGGAGLWRGSLGTKKAGLATHRPHNGPGPQPGGAATTSGLPAPAAPSAPATTLGAPADQRLAQAEAGPSQKKQEIFVTQATAPHASTSSTPMATTTRPRRAAAADRAAGSHRPQSDAAADQLATSGQRRPAGQSLPIPSLPDNQATTHAPAPTLALASAATAAPEIIEVEVRRGAAPAATASPVAVAVAVTNATPAPAARRRLRLGGLLRQADRLVHGESVNLAEATGPAETVTLQARLGGRVLSKTIQL